jgi:hypothetical protein
VAAPAWQHPPPPAPTVLPLIPTPAAEPLRVGAPSAPPSRASTIVSSRPTKQRWVPPAGNLALTGSATLALSVALENQFCALSIPQHTTTNSLSHHLDLLALVFHLNVDDLELIDPLSGTAFKAIHPDTGRDV